MSLNLERDVFCYEPHAPLVHEWLNSIVYGRACDNPSAAPGGAARNAPRVHVVRDDFPLRGHSNIIFVIIEGHQQPVPDRIYHSLQVYGATLWKLDDSWRRDRYNREQLERQGK